MGGGYLCVRMPRGLFPFKSGTSRPRTRQADWLQQCLIPRDIRVYRAGIVAPIPINGVRLDHWE